MRKAFFIALLLPAIACKQVTKESSEVIVEESAEVVTTNYPEEIDKIFAKHGGVDTWKAYRTLSFTLPKPDNPETHAVDLRTRNEKIETPAYTIGFDGKPWVLENNGE